MIIRGHGGRLFLSQALKKQGLNVNIAEVYWRKFQNLDWSMFERAKADIIYVTSVEMVRALFKQVPTHLTQQLKSLLYLTHHERIAQALHEMGVVDVRVVSQLDVNTLNHIYNHALNGAK